MAFDPLIPNQPIEEEPTGFTPWTDIADSEDYQGLDDEQKKVARDYYFDNAIAPDIAPDQIEAARGVFEEEARPVKYDFMGGVRDLTTTLGDLPLHSAASAARIFEGGDPILGGKDDLTDRIIEASEKAATKALQRPGGKDYFLPGIPREAIRTLGQNFGFSVTTMGAGLAAGLTAGAVTGPIGGFTAGGAASGAVAYRDSVNQFTRQIYSAMNEDWKASHNGEEVPLEEWATKKAGLQDIIKKYGLFEAGFEAAGNVAGLGIIVKSLTKILGKSAVKIFLAKATGVLGQELLTETATQIGQKTQEVEAGLAPEEERRSFSKGGDWWKSFKEIAPSVFLLIGFASGPVAIGAKAHRKYIADPKSAELVIKAANSDDLTAVPDEIMAAAMAKGLDVQERRSDDTLLSSAIDTFRGEIDRRVNMPEKERPISLTPGEEATLDSGEAFGRGTEYLAEEETKARSYMANFTRMIEEERKSLAKVREAFIAKEAGQEVKVAAEKEITFTERESRADIKRSKVFEAVEKRTAEKKIEEETVQDYRIKQDVKQPEPLNAMQIALQKAETAKGEPVSFPPGTAAEPVVVKTTAEMPTETAQKALDAGVHVAATSPRNDTPLPSEAQIEAGNYKKAHIKVEGIDISIENPAGSTRSGVDPGGKEWSVKMDQHYGYIKRSEGADAEQIDVFVNPKPFMVSELTPRIPKKIYIVDQKDPKTGAFDEHKVMIGFPNAAMAKAAYLSNYAKGWKGFRSMKSMDIPGFKEWIKTGNTKRPVGLARKPRAKVTQAKAHGIVFKAAREYATKDQYVAHLKKELGKAVFAQSEMIVESAWREKTKKPTLSRKGVRKGNSVVKVKQMLKGPISKLAEFVKVETVQSAADLPFDAPKDTRGGYYRGTAYLVADNITDQNAREVLTHEVVGHLGLEAMLGEEVFDALVRQIQNMKTIGNPQVAKAVQSIYETHGKLDERQEAREILAYFAEKGIKNSLMRRVVAAIRKFLAKIGLGNFDNAFIEDLIAKSARFVETAPKAGMMSEVLSEKPAFSRTAAINYETGEVSEETHSVFTEMMDMIRSFRGKDIGGKAVATQMTEEFNQWDKWVGTLDNLVRRNIESPNVSQEDKDRLRAYMKTAKLLQMDRDDTLSKANAATTAYNSLGAKNPWGKALGTQTEQQKNLSLALFKGTETNKAYTPDVLASEFKLEPQAIEAYQTIRKYFDESMHEYQVRILERVGFNPRQAEALIAGETLEDTGHKLEVIELGKKIVEDFSELKGYFPLMRYGDYVVSVRNAKGELVYFSAQENRLSHNNEVGRIRRTYNDTYTVEKGRLEKNTGESMVLDPRMMALFKEHAEKAGDAGIKDFADEMEQKMLKSFSERTFRKRFIHREGVAGYDHDIVRGIASYGWSSSNYLSKMRYIPRLKDLRDSLDPKNMPRIREKLADDIEYLEKPGEEFARAKSITFAMYMGLNVKSAIVNLTQIPLTLYPYLAHTYGDTSAMVAIMKAQKQTMTGSSTGDERLDRILAWAGREGLTMDQYLSELIGAARGKRAAMARGRSKILESMTFMFSAAEKWNRRTSVAATYFLEKDNYDAKAWENDNIPADLKEKLVNSVQKTQFDYGKFNRPKAFRGIGGIPLQFNQFMVNYLQFLAGNGGGAGARNRSLLILFGMVGIMGMPGADDMRALIEYLLRKSKYGHVDLELEARKHIIDIAREFMGSDAARTTAELVLRGHGAVLPWDLSGSLTVGNPIPGFKKFFDTPGIEAGGGAALKQIAGAGPSLLFKMARGIDEYRVSKDEARLPETLMPNVAIKNALKAYRLKVQGVDRTYTGKVTLDYTPKAIDILGQALSFQPSERSMLYRMKSAGYREESFLRLAHRQLVVPLAVAVAEGDIIRRQRAVLDIMTWNKEAPSKWRLPMARVWRSVRARRKGFKASAKTSSGVKMKQLQKSAQKNALLFPVR